MCIEKCDSLIAAFDQSPYRYTLTPLADYPKVREQLANYWWVASSAFLNGFSIVMMGGKMFLTLSTYRRLWKKWKKLVFYNQY